MPITLQNCEIALRACILYEYLENQPIERSYKNFWGKVGAGAVSFQEFKFWFDRFQCGNHDLESIEKLKSHNLSQVNPEPFEFPSLSDIPEKITEKAWCISFINFMNGVIAMPESISICELPAKILKMVFEKLEPIDRLSIRKVSRLFRSLISQNYIGFKEIKIEVKNDWICLHLDDFVIYYGNLPDSCSVNFKRCKAIIGNSDYMALTLMDLAALLHGPKIKLETLQLNLPIELDTVNRVGFFISLQNILHTVKQISTKKIILEELYADEVVSFLKCFKAGNLKKINLQRVAETKYQLKELVNLEQFKRAQCFFARGTSYTIPMEQLFKLTYFEIQVVAFSKQDAINIGKMLSNSSNLQICCFHFSRSGITDLATVFHPGHVGGEYANLIYKTYNNIKFVINICTKFFKITRK